jgi:hypothetical protein
MSDLQNQTPADTYKGLLQVGDYTDGVDSTAKYISDGEGTPSALSLSTTKVGIGTTSPSAKLDISTNNTTGLRLINPDSAAANQSNDPPAILFQASGWDTDVGSRAYSARIRVNSNYSGASDRGNTHPVMNFDLETNEDNPDDSLSTKMVINADGQVGIGTTSPSAKLDISTTGLDGLRLSVDSQSYYHMIRPNGDSLYIGADEDDSGGTGADIRLNVKGDEKMIIDSNGNVGIGTNTFGSNAVSVLGIKNGTAPTSSPTDMVQLYAKDDSGSSRLYVRNEAGTETVLSPHAADAPSSLYDRPPGVEEMHRSANYYLGTIVFTNVDRRNALMQKQLNGEELPEDRTFTVTETFAEYNTRTGENLQVEDWDANQQAMADADESYVKKPKPDWLH